MSVMMGKKENFSFMSLCFFHHVLKIDNDMSGKTPKYCPFLSQIECCATFPSSLHAIF